MSERLVVYKHALRNALMPIVTIVGLQFGNLISGAVLSETQSEPILSPAREAWRVFRQNKAAVLGLFLLFIVASIMIFGPGLYGVNAFDIAVAPFKPPFERSETWLGTGSPIQVDGCLKWLRFLWLDE